MHYLGNNRGSRRGERAPFSSRAMLLLLLCGCWVLASLSALGQQNYKLDQLRPGTQQPCMGLKFGVLTAIHTRQDLILRVAVFNNGDQDVHESWPLSTSEIGLTVFANGQRLVAHPTTTTLTNVFPEGGLRAHASTAGLMTFALGSDEIDAATLGTMELRVPGFGTHYLRLDPDRLFVPIDWTTVEKRSPLNLEVTPQFAGVTYFPMRLHALLIKDDALEFTVSFKNMGRFAVNWKSNFGGQNAVLVTERGEALHPKEVSESLAHRLAPEGKAWAAGEDNVGWIRFPLPSGLDAGRLGFIMPGYAASFLNYQPVSKTWSGEVRTLNVKGSQSTAAALNEGKVFDQLRRFWQEVSQTLERRDWDRYLEAFRGVALRDQKAAIELWRRVPVATAEFKLSEFQEVKPDAEGRLRKVKVDLRYTLSSLPADNEFMTQMHCDLQRDTEGRWHIDALTYPELQPFWLLGYTEALNSERFLVFFRRGEDGQRQAELAVKQLEKGYAKLLRTGLPLKPRYAAFSIANKDDFQKLTARDPMTYAGAASSGYLMREGKLHVTNEALYLNDFRFFTLQRAWGKQDRQVTILHELVHLALADLTRPWTPAWLTEGTAMYFAGQCDSTARASLQQHLTPAITLTALTQMAHLGETTRDPTVIMSQYQLSGETVKWIVRQQGEKALLALYAAYAAEIPEVWLKAQFQGSRAQAAARLLIGRRVMAKVYSDLSLESLDALIRQSLAQ